MGDDWSTIHWNKIEYLITCGLRPWFLDNTVPGSASSPQQPLLNPSNTLPNPQSNATPDPGQAPEVVQQQPMGQQQAWPVPGQSQQGHFQQGHLQQQGQTLKQQPQQSTAPGQQWPESVGGGGAAAAAVQAVVAVGQPWQAGPGKWQCDVNVSVKNTGVGCQQAQGHKSNACSHRNCMPCMMAYAHCFHTPSNEIAMKMQQLASSDSKCCQTPAALQIFRSPKS